MRSSEKPTTAVVEAALVDHEHDAYVDMVLSSPEPGRYRAACSTGSVEFHRVTDVTADDSGHPVERPAYDVDSVTGIDPLRSTDVAHLVGLSEERALPCPDRDANSYPHAHDQIAQFFDAPHAPDLVVQHTAGHRFGTNLGEHGSLGIVQARAPFIASGAGVPARGALDVSARMVDVAPTLLRLLGTDPHPNGIGSLGTPRPGALLARQDGDELVGVVDPGEARHVVVILLDGCNANALYDAIADGSAPAIADLAATGTTLRHGLMASLPTATLANHTTASTGVHPGHSGVLHNMWLDRHRDVTPDLLAMDQMFDAMVHLGDGIETIHQAVHRSRSGAFTASLFEFCDTGADVSSFADFRAGRPPALPAADTLADASVEFVGASGAYSFMSSVDELATRQAVDLWDRRDGNPLPDLTFLSLALTDESGHEGGPHSEIARAAIVDSDRRVARVVEAVERSGARRHTAFVVIADHGMEANDPTEDEPWARVLERAVGRAGLGDGAAVADVADGLLYLR